MQVSWSRGESSLADGAWAGAWPPASHRGPGCTWVACPVCVPAPHLHPAVDPADPANCRHTQHACWRCVEEQVPTATVHCITFVAPPVGNEAFVHAFRCDLIQDRKLNTRIDALCT